MVEGDGGVEVKMGQGTVVCRGEDVKVHGVIVIEPDNILG